MAFSQHDHDFYKRLAGISAVVLVHVVVLYALLTGWGKQIISVIHPLPIEVNIIPPVTKLSPPLVPPPAATIPPTQRIATSRPFIPKPELPVPQSAPTSNTIQAVNNEEPPRSEIQVQVPSASESAPASSVAHAVVDAIVNFATCNKPDYPRNSLRNEEQGTVRIQFLIDLDGQVADAKIEKSSGFRALDAAAKNALRLCKFKPGTLDGKPQQSWTTVDYVWKLPD